MRSLKLVLCRVQCAPGLPNLIKFENGLDLFRAPGRFDQDKAENITPRKCDFRMVGDFLKGSFNVSVSGLNFGLLRGRHLSSNRHRFSNPGKKDLQLDKRRVGKLRLIDVRTVFRNREALRSPSGEPSDLPRKPEFNGVDDTALAGPVRA